MTITKISIHCVLIGFLEILKKKVGKVRSKNYMNLFEHKESFNPKTSELLAAKKRIRINLTPTNRVLTFSIGINSLTDYLSTLRRNFYHREVTHCFDLLF